MKETARNGLILALLGVGAALFLVMVPRAQEYNLSLVGRGYSTVAHQDLTKRVAFFLAETWIERLVLLFAVILTFLTVTRKAIAALFGRLRRASAPQRRWTALAVALLSGPLLYGLGAARGRLMLPIWHDENMYRLQTTFLAHGKFCMPGLPLPEFFDSPYVLVHRVYAPTYFPGTAMLHVPAAGLHLPYWLTPLIIAVISLTLLYLIVSELIDGLAGLLAVLLMISLVSFRWLALVEMSHAAGMMWGLVGLWAWLAWRRSHRIGWTILAGAAAGFYLITRPLDALCVLTPVAIAWSWDLRKVSRRAVIATLVTLLAAAAPLLAVQLAFDRAVTGNAFEMPLDKYNRTYLNAKSIGLQQFDPAFRPPTPVPQLLELYCHFHVPKILSFTTLKLAAQEWIQTRVPLTLGAALPALLLLILLPVAVVGLSDARRWVLWSMSWCYLIGAGFFYVFLPHYTIAAAPAVIFAVVLAVSVIQRAWPASSAANVFLPLGVLFLAIEYIGVNQQNFFEPIPIPHDPRSHGWVSQYNYRQIPSEVHKPALVFYRFGPGEEAWEEPVYNWDVLNPDDAPIIRAHDLGPFRDLALLAYYLQKQPGRHVYLFDRQSLMTYDLGGLHEAGGRLMYSVPWPVTGRPDLDLPR